MTDIIIIIIIIVAIAIAVVIMCFMIITFGPGVPLRQVPPNRLASAIAQVVTDVDRQLKAAAGRSRAHACTRACPVPRVLPLLSLPLTLRLHHVHPTMSCA